jgi:transposase InsO family protein
MLSQELSTGSRIWAEFPVGVLLLPVWVPQRLTRPPRAGTEAGSLEERVRWPGVTVDSQSANIAIKSGELLVHGTMQIGRLDGLVPDTPVRKLYLQTVVDAHGGMAFAKVYAGKGPLTAVDILLERVLPFYEKHGVPVQEIETGSGRAYCGRLLTHPYELFLETRGIQHRIARAAADPPLACLDAFQRILRKEFLAPVLRRRVRLALSQLQADLDAFLEGFNRERTMVTLSGQSRTPRATFLENPSVPVLKS